MSALVEVAACDGEDLLVDAEEEIHCAFVDVEAGEVGQEVVSDKDVEEDEIVDDAFEFVREREGGAEVLELEVEVLAEEGEVEEEEVLGLEAALGLAAGAELDLFTEEAEVGVVAEEAEHDEVGVEAVEAVADVGVVAGLCLAETDVLHDLVLALTGHVVAGEDDLYVAPVCILGDLLCDKVFELLGELCHEGGAWGDAVGVEGFLVREDLAATFCLFLDLLCLLCGTETTGTLLVHLCAWGDAVDGEEEDLFGLDLVEEMLYIGEYG
ncbi:hypothetical protein L1887_57195 [Cichorium endivia]|nr:hypothetical protein L1887_57195 [Cichorium endivia]